MNDKPASNAALITLFDGDVQYLFRQGVAPSLNFGAPANVSSQNEAEQLNDAHWSDDLMLH